MLSRPRSASFPRPNGFFLLTLCTAALAAARLGREPLGLALLALATLVLPAFHEGGHALAARLGGIRLRRLLILPGYGRLTVNGLHDGKFLAMVFAGPVAGALGAMALFAALGAPRLHAPGYLRAMCLAAIADNLLNLAPLGILDGGYAVRVRREMAALRRFRENARHGPREGSRRHPPRHHRHGVPAPAATHQPDAVSCR